MPAGLGLGYFLGGHVTILADRWMFNTDPIPVPGVSYKMIVAATFFTVTGCTFKL